MASVSTASTSDEVTIGNLDGLVGYHLRRASAVVGNDFSRALDGTGMRQVLFGILSIVNANPGINQGAVGRALGIQRANMVSLINELVDRDLLDRKTAAEDRRAFSLTLSPDGVAMFDNCLKRIRAHEDRLLSDLEPAERTALIDLLSRIEAKER
ncbi:MAG: MarR family transcriptional regulator [Pseudomonadota bacterium]